MTVYYEGVIGGNGGFRQQKTVKGVVSKQPSHKIFHVFDLVGFHKEVLPYFCACSAISA